jgi:hypothetical protein
MLKVEETVEDVTQYFVSNALGKIHLCLNGINVNDDTLHNIIQEVKLNPSIQTLSLRNLGIQNSHEMLNKTRSPFYIQMYFVGLGPKHAIMIADLFETNATITSCDLSGNAIGSHGSKCLTDSLRQNVSLTHLSLRKCNLGTDGITDWIKFIESNGHQSALYNIKY